MQVLRNTVGHGILDVLLKPKSLGPERLIDFERLKVDVRPGDVILVEGRTQVGQIIQIVTHSRWSHSAMCVGLLAQFKQHLPKDLDTSTLDANTVYLIEAELGKGTILTPIDEYKDYRVRVCRPAGLTHSDQTSVVCYAVKRLGTEYNVRQLADLARFLFPYGILPRKWRSSLFEHNAGPETKIVCSTLIADAFQAVKFPVLPIISEDDQGESRLFKRNAKLFAPSDFDISPYFEILKFPKYSLNERRYYHHLPWANKDTPVEEHIEIDPAYQQILAKKKFARLKTPMEVKS